MNDKPKTFNQEGWHAYVNQKYGNKTISASVLHNERVKLEKKYGEKIILEKLEDMTTDEEKMDKLEYEAITSVLQETVPDMKRLDNSYKNLYKIQRFIKLLLASGKKIFWIILGILLMLAVIKYLLT